MASPPKWYLPVTIVALLWNLVGCAAYLSDVTLTPADIAEMTAAQQQLYASRPAWAVAGTATAVWAGALGSLGLMLRRRWAMPLLAASLAGVVVQDVWLFLLADAAGLAGPAVFAFQGLVLAVAIGLVALARTARGRGWMKA